MIKITDAEKEMISKLNHPLYTVEFLEHWVNRNDNPMINAPAALQAMGAKGYLDAVQQMVSTQGNLQNCQKLISNLRDDLQGEVDADYLERLLKLYEQQYCGAKMKGGE